MAHPQQNASIKLFYTPGAASLAVRILAHELNIPCLSESVNPQTKVTGKGENYAAINPNCKVPALQINQPNQAPVTLTETPTIMAFLVNHSNPYQTGPQSGQHSPLAATLQASALQAISAQQAHAQQQGPHAPAAFQTPHAQTFGPMSLQNPINQPGQGQQVAALQQAPYQQPNPFEPLGAQPNTANPYVQGCQMVGQAPQQAWQTGQPGQPGQPGQHSQSSQIPQATPFGQPANPTAFNPCTQQNPNQWTAAQAAQIQICETLLPSPQNPQHYAVTQSLNFISSEVQPNLEALFNPEIPNNVKENVFEKKVINQLDQLNQMASGNNRYLLGNEFTAADAALFVALSWLPKSTHLSISRWANLEKAYQAMKQRPSVQRACEEEGLALCNQ